MQDRDNTKKCYVEFIKEKSLYRNYINKQLEINSSNHLLQPIPQSKMKCIPVAVYVFISNAPSYQLCTLCSTDVIFSLKLLTINQTRSPDNINL